MRGEARPHLLDTSRIQLELQRVKPTHSKIGEELEKLLGTVEIKVKRWFDLWKYLKWLLPQWDRLGFNMQSQQQTNWCWAATSTSTAVYYNATTTWTQCTVANGETGRTDCCGTGGSGACNVYGFLDTALTRVRPFRPPRQQCRHVRVHEDGDQCEPAGRYPRPCGPAVAHISSR